MTSFDRICIARIFSDLIMADRIIDIGEMNYWEKICDNYDITKQHEIGSRNVTLADALNHISRCQDTNLKKMIWEDCKKMTISDGFCAHSEALLIIALRLLLNANSIEKPAIDDGPGWKWGVEAISIRRANFNIEEATALYIESEYDASTNEAINENYRIICKELRLAGFQFIYLPAIIRHYEFTQPKVFRQILSFLAPQENEENITRIYKNLMSMTSSSFCTDLFCNKLKIVEFRNTPPSLLIKIGNSFVDKIPYANYLKVEVDEDIVSMLQNIIDCFCSFLSSDTIVIKSVTETGNQFQFHGFYKQLFDIFLQRGKIESRILINCYDNGLIDFPDINSSLSNSITRRERAFYTLLLCYGNSGINFSQPDNNHHTLRRMARIQKRYAAIYGMFGGEPQKAPDILNPQTRRPIIARLRRALSNLTDLYNQNNYQISGNRNFYSVNLSENLIYVKDFTASRTQIHLKDSELYQRWKDIH